VAVVCAGAKSILDLPATLEMLETLGVPVLGSGTHDFPAFYVRGSGLAVSARVDSAEEIAAILSAHWRLRGAGVVVAQPLPEDHALEPGEFAGALQHAELLAASAGVKGPALTPFLLARLAEITGGKTLVANTKLLIANARLAAETARALLHHEDVPSRG
jgi:pseudouridine-5'-phosphate glycosidase